MLSQSIILLVLCSQIVSGTRKELCDPTDYDCITKAVQEHVYAQFVAGSPGVEPLDPLRLDTINADLPNLKYTLKNPTLLGMKDCHFLKIKLTVDEAMFSYELLCPKLSIQSKYEAKGEIDTTTVEGKGSCKIAYENYGIHIIGKYEKIKSEDDKLHFHIMDHSFDLNLKSDATTEYDNLVIGDLTKAVAISKKLEESTRDTVMKTFLDKFIKNLKDFHKAIPLTDLHFRLVAN